MVGISEWTKTNEGLRQRLNVATGQRRSAFTAATSAPSPAPEDGSASVAASTPLTATATGCLRGRQRPAVVSTLPRTSVAQGEDWLACQARTGTRLVVLAHS